MAEAYEYELPQDPRQVNAATPAVPQQDVGTPYTQITGMEQPPPTGPMGMPAATQGLPEEVKQIQRPAANSEELSQRVAGWKAIWEKATSDPNLMRAIGMAGASLGQPPGFGQSRMGQLGQAYTVGQTAFDAGNLAARTQEIQDKELAMKQAESTSKVAYEGARTDTERAGLPKVTSEAEVASATTQTRIDQAKETLAKTKFDLEKAKSVEQVEAIEREHKKRVAELKKTIPDTVLTEGLLAEVNEAIAKAKKTAAEAAQATAHAGAFEATARKTGTEADMAGEALRIFRSMSPEEQKAAAFKTGKYAGHTSAITQQGEMYGSLYDGLKPDSPWRAGRTREEFILEQLRTAKIGDVSRNKQIYMQGQDTAGLPHDPAMLRMFDDLIAAQGGMRGATPPPPNPNPNASQGAKPDKKGAAAPAAKENWVPSQDPAFEQWLDPSTGRLKVRRKAAAAPAPASSERPSGMQ